MVIIIIVVLLVIPAPTRRTAVQLQTTITVTGTITAPGGGSASGVWIGVGSSQDWQEAITNGSGFYSLSLQTDGNLWFHIRPEVSTRLAQVNLWMGGVASDVVQDFTLEDGYLLSVQPTGSGGTPLTTEIGLEVLPLVDILADNQWYIFERDNSTNPYQAVLPGDIYYVSARDVPAGYFETTQPFDLRAGDISLNLPLNTSYVHPIPYNPPEAIKISVGPPDDLGEAVVSGSPGAALPLARILLVNLNATHQAQTTSEADGSFSARIYAPPGSAIMVKHGPASHRWNDLEMGLSEGINPFPGTIINVPHTHTGDSYQLPFAAAGAINYYTDDPGNTRNYVGSAWAITGTIGPAVVDGEWTQVLTGTYNSEVVPGLYLGGLNWTHPSLGDLDGDNDLDLLVGERGGQLAHYENAGDVNTPNWQFAELGYAGINTSGWAYPALMDVTGEGTPDLFLGTGDGGVAVYYSTGGDYPTIPDETLPSGLNAAPALDDLDGDGDYDLLVGHDGGTLFLFRNNGTSITPVWTLESDAYAGISEAEGWLQPAFLDLDGDNDRDLLIGFCGWVIWYERGGTNMTPTWTRQDSDPIGYGGGSCGTSFGTGDLSGDGQPDIVIGEHWGNLRFFQDSGPTSWTEVFYEFPIDLAGDSAPALADWDDDGDLDMLVGQAHGSIQVYSNTGSAADPAWFHAGEFISLPPANHPHPYPTFADIDDDDDYDLFVGEGNWDGPETGGGISFYQNDGNPSTANWNLVTADYLGYDVGGWSTPVFVDIDNDNDLDLFIGDAAGTLTYVENIGNATSPSWGTPEQPYEDMDFGSYSAPSFFDLDQDGDMDMLVGSQEGSLAYVRNTGTVNNPAWEMVSNVHPAIDIGENSMPAAADLNNDGQADLLIGDGDGGLNFYLYQGPGTPPTAGEPYAAGDLIQVEGTLHLHSPAITTTTDLEPITVNGWVGLMLLNDQNGKPFAAENYFMSTMLTPSGFPIQRSERSAVSAGVDLRISDLHYLPDHTIEGALSLSGRLPEDLPFGIYRPVLSLDITGVPTSTEWLAANVTQYTYGAQEAALPPITVGDVGPPRLTWRLLMDDAVQGTHGTGAREDRGNFEHAPQIVSQGAPYYMPPIEAKTGQPLTYRLEPFLPTISFTDRRMPAAPLIPFVFPSGELCTTVQKPDGTTTDLGCEAFAQSFNRTKTTSDGHDLNIGTTQMDDVYSLKAASDRFRLTFDQYGHHLITMNGTINDVWGNTYYGGGTYDVWAAQPLDIDPGVLPGAPLAVGDSFNPAFSFNPRLPARLSLTLTHSPYSDPTQVVTYTLTGEANSYGYFSSNAPPITLAQPGEYRVDVTAVYTDAIGTLYMGALTWGGIVMTPDGDADLIAHGRRGVDSISSIPDRWFVSCRDLPIQPGAITHTLNPYFNGDMVWSRMVDGAGECPAGVASGGDALVMGASVQDTVGTIEAAIQTRFDRRPSPTSPPGDINDRFSKGELPLFSSTHSGQPVHFLLGEIGTSIPEDVDQIAYSYRSSQRPGVRVREIVAEDDQSGGYWRLDTLYDDQLGVGIQGDQPNDFKFQYVGAVYRDLDSGHSEYVGQGSGWVFIPDSDTTGTRVMPPFSGPGNGGWTTEGGPIMTLKGDAIHIFILPTGVRPGGVLQIGDTFHFAGHIMPTLDSQVTYTVTAPSGAEHTGGGQANAIGYFYDPQDNFPIDETGLWSVDVHVWHDGQCSGGSTIPPYPSGDVLGSDNGRYWFYVVEKGAPRLQVSSPTNGFLSFENEVTPIQITGEVPNGLSNASVDYTISMPGTILEHGSLSPTTSTFAITFDPVVLHNDFPNLDLIGREAWDKPGLADTFSISLLLNGQVGNENISLANSITLQGNQVFVKNRFHDPDNMIFIPLVSRQ